MNKDGVLSEFIYRDASTPQTIAEEEAAMKQLASTYQQFDFDYITAGQSGSQKYAKLDKDNQDIQSIVDNQSSSRGI